MTIKKKLTPIIISASMILLLFTGCSGSTSTVANSSEAEKSETIVENAGSEVTEIVEVEEPVMEAQEGSTVAETNASDTAEKRYLVKSEIMSMPSPDGKGKSFFDAREYDYDEFGHIIHMHVYNYEGQKGDEYYEYELDDEGRILKQQKLDGNKEKSGYIEYSYTGDHYKALYYGQSGWLLESHEGFVKDGVYYRTERVFYDNEKHKTEADEEYDSKVKVQYDGTMEVKSEEFDANGEKTKEFRYDYELDENNNPVVRKTNFIDGKTGEESLSMIIEYTYIEF